MMKHALGVALMLPLAAQAETLTVYAPDYFTSEWGPGPQIEEAFEATCDCDLEYVTTDLLPRFKLEGERTEADVAIGFNTDIAAKARETGLFAPHRQDTSDLTMPIDWTDETFLPYNWGFTAFVYNTELLAEPPESFEALLNAPDDLKLVIQDPRSSISGLALVLWVKQVYGDEAGEAWKKLKPKVMTVTKDWSESYGLFTSGEADMVLSYTTSPAYHIIAEEDDTKRAAIFPEGHYFMVETAAKLAGTDNPELADKFMAFVLSHDFQSLIDTANWSYPAKLPKEEWPEEFTQLGYPDKALFYSEEEAAALRDETIAEWLDAMR